MRRLFTAWCLAGVVAVAAPALVQHATAQGAAPAGATAKCGDGSFSKAKTKRGACSGHGGVATWLGGEEKTTAATTPKTKTSTRNTTEAEPRPAARATTGSAKAPAPRTAPAPSDAADATAQCNDGTYSHAQQHRGACSNHGGVKTWFK